MFGSRKVLRKEKKYFKKKIIFLCLILIYKN